MAEEKGGGGLERNARNELYVNVATPRNFSKYANMLFSSGGKHFSYGGEKKKTTESKLRAW